MNTMQETEWVELKFSLRRHIVEELESQAMMKDMPLDEYLGVLLWYMAFTGIN